MAAKGTTPFDTLVQYFGRPVSAPKSLDVAKYILLNAATERPLGPGSLDNGGNEPSLMGRIFDVLSRPNYAMAEAFRTGGNPEAIWQGLSGKNKTTFSDVLAERGVEDPKLRAYGGLLLDIGLDPTTYIPGGAIAKGASKLKGAVRGTKDFSRVVASDKNLAQKLLDRGDPVYPEAFGLPRETTPEIPEILRRPEQSTEFVLGRNSLRDQEPPTRRELGATSTVPGQLELPFEGMPSNLPQRDTGLDEVEPPVGKEVPGTVGQVPFRFPDFTVKGARSKAAVDKAEDIVQKAATGDSESMLRMLPQPDQVKIGAREQRAAAEIVAAWDNSKSTAHINQKYPETLNARQQVRLYQSALEKARKRFRNPNARVNKTRISSDAYKIYLATERALEAKGLVPRIGTGENVRMSEVIQQLGGHSRATEVLSEFGNEIKAGSPTWQVIEALRARGSVTETKTVQNIIEKIQESHVVTEKSNLVSDGFIDQFDRVIKKIGSASARAEGLSPAAIRATDSLINDALQSGKSPAQLVIEQKAKMIDEILAKGKANADVTHATTKALEADLGKLPQWAVTDNKAVEFFMSRVATWWGQKDLRPLSLNAIGSSNATAAARGQALDNLFAPFKVPERHEAMRLAQGLGQPSTPEVFQLANQITRLMDNLVGQATGHSVVTRSAIHMEAINKWMNHYKVGFHFTNKTAKDMTGKTVDYSKGTDWLQSWKSAQITEDPKIFLFKLQQALEHATREKALFDEVGERFGARAPGKGYTNKIKGCPYLDGYWFPNDIAQQIPRFVRDWNLPGWNPQSKIVRLYDRVLSMWKSGVTIYRPAHHLRNMVGDVYLGWMDGVNSLRPYTLAARVQRSMRGSYDTLENVDELVRVGILGKQYGTPMPGQVLFKNKSGVTFTAEQIGAVAHQKGLLEHANTLEDIIDMGDNSRIKPFGGRVQKVARGASELQNHNARLAHFIDKVMKSRGTDLDEIFEQASRRARKWHPSGLDLTDFERTSMRRIIPFYSWMRKSLPLLLEGLVMNPGKALIPAKIYDAMQEANGVDTPGRTDPFPVDQMFPEWIRAQGVGPISGPDGMLGSISNQSPPGYVMGGMGLNPLTELMTQIESPGRSLTSSLTPALSIPIELMTGRKLFTGEPISGADARPGAAEQYIGEQIPFFSAVQGITGVTPFGTETKSAARSGGDASLEALINWLTGAGIKGTGPYINQGRYEKQAPLRTQRSVDKEKFLEYLRSQVGE